MTLIISKEDFLKKAKENVCEIGLSVILDTFCVLEVLGHGIEFIALSMKEGITVLFFLLTTHFTYF